MPDPNQWLAKEIITIGLDQYKFRSVKLYPLGPGEGPSFAEHIVICLTAE